MKNDEIKYVCQSTVIKDYGIPKRLVEKYLPNPKLVDNPHYKCAPEMMLYDKAKVENLIQTNAEVQNAVAKRKQRIASAQKATQTKLRNMMNRIAQATANIHVYVEENVEDLALASCEWLQWCDATPDENEIREITFNYVLESMTDCDDKLWNASVKDECGESLLRYKIAVLDKIAEAYPKLKGLCNNQKNHFLRKIRYSRKV